jgi:CBS domain containing-hemolysin-like protein
MVRSVFRSTDTAVKSLMTHRIDVFSLNMHLSIREALPTIMARSFSRIPVFDDNSENIKGVVLVKQLIKHMAQATATDLSGMDIRADITIADFLKETVGRIPFAGERIDTPIGSFTVEESSHTRIINSHFVPRR